MESKGRRLHAQALEAREKKQEFARSLALTDEALFAYDGENDPFGFAEAIANRSITLRVYANEHDSRRFLTLAKYEMMGSVVIARESGDEQALALPLYNLAQIQEDLGELPDALLSYKEALHCMIHTPPERHNRPEVLANMKIHMATCEYKTGDKTALGRAEAALHDLEGSQNPNKYEQAVLLSGGFMLIVDALRKDNPEKAKELLQKAKEIIDSNPELELRRRQWEKLSSSFAP